MKIPKGFRETTAPRVTGDEQTRRRSAIELNTPSQQSENNRVEAARKLARNPLKWLFTGLQTKTEALQTLIDDSSERLNIESSTLKLVGHLALGMAGYTREGEKSIIMSKNDVRFRRRRVVDTAFHENRHQWSYALGRGEDVNTDGMTDFQLEMAQKHADVSVVTGSEIDARNYARKETWKNRLPMSLESLLGEIILSPLTISYIAIQKILYDRRKRQKSQN